MLNGSNAAVLGMLVQGVFLVIWGAKLTQRVKALEEDIAPLKALVVQVARLEVKQDGILEQLKDMNSSLRWLRQPAEYQQGDLQRPGGR